MRGVLLIAVLLRFMDSFMIYTEPFVVTGGGPGNSTTFLSIDLVKIAVGQFDLGPAAAISIVYFLIILVVCWVFYTVMTSVDADGRRPSHEPAAAVTCLMLYFVFLLLPIYWLVNMSFKTNDGDPRRPHAVAAAAHARTTTHGSSPIRPGTRATSTRSSMSRSTRHSRSRVALPAAYAFSRYQLPRRQAPVLLAADQPHGAAGGVPAAVLPALLGDRAVRHAYRGGAGALPVQRAARGLDPRRLHVRRAAGRSTRPPISTATRSRASSSRSSCR